jgi:hypothetical protein
VLYRSNLDIDGAHVLVDCIESVAAIVECKIKWILRTTPKSGDDRVEVEEEEEEYRGNTCMVKLNNEYCYLAAYCWTAKYYTYSR